MSEHDGHAAEQRWALWRLLCGFTAVGAADTHLNSGRLYCPVCGQDQPVIERTAWVTPVPEADRLRP